LVIVAQYLQWREFIIAFFVMAFAISIPDLFTTLSAAAQHQPELALGDILGGNLVDLTLVLALSVFFSKKSLGAKSNMVQTSAIFTTIIAVLPLLLILDSDLSRFDGVILIISFLLYSVWIFSKREHFQDVYNSHKSAGIVSNFKNFLKNLLKIIVLLILLVVAAQAVVWSAQYFALQLGVSLSLVGILIVGLGNAIPDTYFSVISARKEKNWLVLGNLMGSVIVCATLVLGVLALVSPFHINDFSPFLNARIFLIIAALLSLIFIRTGKEITRREAMMLLFVYIVFLMVEVFLK
jgi:cation:H+ antiporter